MRALQHNRIFFAAYALLLIALSILVLQTERFELFASIYSQPSPWGDRIFPYISQLGTPIFIVPFMLLCSSRNTNTTRWTYYVISALVWGLCIYTLKMYFDTPRPMNYPLLRTIHDTLPQVEQLLKYSYPSGHSSAIWFAFTLFLLVNKRTLIGQMVCVFVAVSVMYSRVYLGMHFVEDTLAGSYIGLAIPLAIYAAFYRTLDPVFEGS